MVAGGRRVGEPPRSRRTASQAWREGDARHRVGWREYSRRREGTVEPRGEGVERVESDSKEGCGTENGLAKRKSSIGDNRDGAG